MKKTATVVVAVHPGGAKGIRTPDLNTASVALSQLSYGPGAGGGEGIRTPDLDSAIVALSQLSYTPAHAVVSYHEGREMSNDDQPAR